MTETHLLLRYGTKDSAMIAWVNSWDKREFTANETEIIKRYINESFNPINRDKDDANDQTTT